MSPETIKRSGRGAAGRATGTGSGFLAAAGPDEASKTAATARLHLAAERPIPW
jgi:hypothetical protein